jgi:LacI family transcriptional regulator
MKKITIQDIARLAGVASSTVSMVVSGKARQGRISVELEKKILEIVEKEGYKPNQAAVSFRTGKSRIIGLIVENISGHFFGSLAKVVAEEMERAGYHIIYCSTDNDPAKGRELIRMLSQRTLDGYLITPTAGMEQDIALLYREAKPVVLIDSYFPDDPTPYVLTDGALGVKQGMEHLLSKNYRRIAFITVDLQQKHIVDREDAYKSALTDNHAGFEEKLILKVRHDLEKEASIRLIAGFLLAQKPEAVFFATDYLGVLGLASIRRSGMRIPEDIAVICFDDPEIFSMYTPCITAIRQPIDQIGKTAVRILMGEMGVTKKVSKNQRMIRATLIERDSC